MEEIKTKTEYGELAHSTDNKLKTVRNALKSIQESLGHIIDLLDAEGDVSDVRTSVHDMARALSSTSAGLSYSKGDHVVEGVYDGQKMISQEGEIHEVPANYASKSKLVEGDILKLTITKQGNRIFKQISPVERTRVVGSLAIDESSGNYYIMVDGQVYRVNAAAVTYYKGEVGDEVVALLSKGGDSKWAAIENIIKR